MGKSIDDQAHYKTITMSYLIRYMYYPCIIHQYLYVTTESVYEQIEACCVSDTNFYREGILSLHATMSLDLIHSKNCKYEKRRNVFENILYFPP